MTSCPCCSSQLLRHVRGTQIYWFCRNCWQEMPELEVEAVHSPALALMTEGNQRGSDRFWSISPPFPQPDSEF